VVLEQCAYLVGRPVEVGGESAVLARVFTEPGQPDQLVRDADQVRSRSSISRRAASKPSRVFM
jgi:hypothetical protein